MNILRNTTIKANNRAFVDDIRVHSVEVDHTYHNGKHYQTLMISGWALRENLPVRFDCSLGGMHSWMLETGVCIPEHLREVK